MIILHNKYVIVLLIIFFLNNCDIENVFLKMKLLCVYFYVNDKKKMI